MSLKSIISDPYETEKKLYCLAIDLLKRLDRSRIQHFISLFKDKNGDYMAERLKVHLNQIKEERANERNRKRNDKNKANVGKQGMARKALQNAGV